MPHLKVALVANDLPPTPDWVGHQLAEQGISLVERECTALSEVVETAGDADVVWTMGGSRVITPDVLPLLPRCRAILRTGTGTDNIPVSEAMRLGIVVANTPEVTMHQVAEHAIGLLFAVIRQIARQDGLVRRGVWDRYAAWPDWHLAGQTFGLLGFGRIARLVAKKISGFEMNIIACDPAVEAGVMAEHGIQKVAIDELFSRSDFISVHVPLLETTRRSIGEAQFRLMKPKAVLINTARERSSTNPRWCACSRSAGSEGQASTCWTPSRPRRMTRSSRLDNVVITPAHRRLLGSVSRRLLAALRRNACGDRANRQADLGRQPGGRAQN